MNQEDVAKENRAWKNPDRQERRDRNRSLVQAFVALIVVAALVSFNIWYTADQSARSDRRWCQLMQPLDKRYQALKTEDPSAIEFRNSLHVLVGQLGCPKETR